MALIKKTFISIKKTWICIPFFLLLVFAGEYVRNFFDIIFDFFTNPGHIVLSEMLLGNLQGSIINYTGISYDFAGQMWAPSINFPAITEIFRAFVHRIALLNLESIVIFLLILLGLIITFALLKLRLGDTLQNFRNYIIVVKEIALPVSLIYIMNLFLIILLFLLMFIIFTFLFSFAFLVSFFRANGKFFLLPFVMLPVLIFAARLTLCLPAILSGKTKFTEIIKSSVRTSKGVVIKIIGMSVFVSIVTTIMCGLIFYFSHHSPGSYISRYMVRILANFFLLNYFVVFYSEQNREMRTPGSTMSAGVR